MTKHIQVYENVIPHDFCDMLIEKYVKTLELYKSRALMREEVEEIEIPCGSGEVDGIDPETESLWHDGGINDEIERISWEILEKYIEPYMTWKYDFRYTGTKMLHYEQGKHSPMHYDDELMSKPGDGSFGQARPITILWYLNDDFQGGETTFQDQKMIITPKKGSVAVFPASFMYPHTTVPAYRKPEDDPNNSAAGRRYVLLPFFVKSGITGKLKSAEEKKKKNIELAAKFKKSYR